jgi:hypothetical protein
MAVEIQISMLARKDQKCYAPFMTARIGQPIEQKDLSQSLPDWAKSPIMVECTVKPRSVYQKVKRIGKFLVDI